MKLSNTLRTLLLRSALVGGIGVAAVGLMGQYRGNALWWEPSNGDALPEITTFADPTGELMVYNANGSVRTATHPFFQNMGSNGRACVTCHQPSNAMSLSASRVQERWQESQGADPVFAAIDGSNCPNLPQGLKSSHSLLLTRGVFRIPMPWPAAGVTPEFTIEVVRDPTGCNNDPVYGLKSAHPTISVYRRPRVVANLKYVLGEDAFGLGQAHGSLAADGRDASLEAQALDAVHAHEQAERPLSKAMLEQILEFEGQVFVAQNMDDRAGDLAEIDGPKGLGVWNLGRGKVSPGTANGDVFAEVSTWNTGLAPSALTEHRASVERGSEIFQSRRFAIDAAGLSGSKTGTGRIEGTCATCHTAPMAGSNLQQRPMDVGTTVLPHADDAKDLPLFKVTCRNDAPPHPYAGRVIYTTDPGRALVTGKCADVGSIVMQQFRGLSARAPYFANGSAATLADVVDFYDRRFAMGLNAQEKKDLVNFLGVL